MAQGFLPMTMDEARRRGWDEVDFVYVSGDAYVDHPSFGAAIITRVLEANGYRVGVIAQPDWTDPQSIAVFGEPRLGFLVSAGNGFHGPTLHLCRKSRDETTPIRPEARRGFAPITPPPGRVREPHSSRLQENPYHSWRHCKPAAQTSHYDYWSDKLKRSILLDSGADIVSYGMGATIYRRDCRCTAKRPFHRGHYVHRGHGV